MEISSTIQQSFKRGDGRTQKTQQTAWIATTEGIHEINQQPVEPVGVGNAWASERSVWSEMNTNR